MTERLDLPRRYRDQIEALLREHVPGVEVWAYGSRVSGRSHEGSDLDLVLRGPNLKRIDSGQLADLIEALEESNVPIIVQTHDWARLPERFHREIEREYVVLVGKEEWKIVTLRDLGTIITGKTPSTRRETNFGGQIPFVTPRDLDDGRMIYKTERYLTDAGAYTVKNAVIPANTVMVSCIGSDMGKVAIAGKRCVTNQQINSIIINDKFDYKYIYYSLSTRKDELRDQAGGSAVPILNKGHFGDIETYLPPLSEQRAIAHILGTLDDKIELNRRMNETLEEMARALFKSWFVDFDPVRAKMEGRDTGLPPDVADLFPDRLVDSELGEIPEGWEVGCLADIAVAPRRGADPTSLHDDTPYIGLEHMPRRSVALTQWEGAGKVTSNKSVFKEGEFLFGKLRPYFHKVGIAPVGGICSTDVIVIAPKASYWSSFVLASISSDEFVAYANQTSTGTKMPRTSWKTISEYWICLPSAHAVQAFQDAVQPMIDGIVANVHGSHTLVALRDTILPKLISGEIQVNSWDEESEAIGKHQ